MTQSNKSYTGKTPLKRKFPGPAGLVISTNKQQTQTNYKLNDIPCSQNTFALFKNGPWEQMRRDFKLLNDEDAYLTDKYNIDWVKSMAKKKKLPNHKVPFLAGIVLNINIKAPVVSIALKDPTGQINGVIMYDLFENYNKDLIKGSVIILKQVGVLTTKTSNYYLTITANNLVRIYSSNNIISLCRCTVNDFVNDGNGTRKSKHQLVEQKEVVAMQENKDAKLSLSAEDEEALHIMFDDVNTDSFFDEFYTLK